MASFTFVLKEPQAQGATLVYFIVRHRNKRMKISTGIQIEPYKWDSLKWRINRKATLSEQAGNSVLVRFEGDFNLYKGNSANVGSEFTLSGFQEFRADKYKPKQKEVEKVSLLDFINSFIQESNRKPETKRAYTNTLRRLKEYAKHSKQELTFEQVDLSLMNDLIKYFEKVKGYSLNSINLHVKNLKVFMKEAKERGLHNVTTHESRRFTVSTESTPKIYLTEQELDQLRRADLSDKKHLERVRDLFLIQMNTGVRVSDLSKIDSKNLKREGEGYFFQIRQKKTSDFLWIPVLDSEVLEILNKYEGCSPGFSQKGNFITLSKYNEYLKEVGKRAEILETFTTYRTKGGKQEEVVRYKFELISSHTARRSFATNAYKDGYPSESIMAITGHKTESSFHKYIQLSSKEHALELMKRQKNEANKKNAPHLRSI